ncbi:MAG TPA: phytoene/squalene synthase family protein [Gammaproteobacteria bacterium]|nr:phytoene/squalene synthase family protein [Gammaproteobacteria bacterium]
MTKVTQASGASAPRDYAATMRCDAEGQAADLRSLQQHLLLGVSRTFALTIPQLPAGLRDVISNHYLLCRIVDTIEDEPTLAFVHKRHFCAQFVEVTSTGRGARQFAEALAPKLSAHTIAAEHELIRATPAVIAMTLSFNQAQRDALARCVRVMTEGMVEFQAAQRPAGLKDLAELDRYCYHVAGVVGETLTELFCEYSPEIAVNRTQLMKLAVSFGQGLQMTNILKDLWDDRRRGACWLPQDVFNEVGFDLKKLAPDGYVDAFGRGLSRLIGIAQAHLDNAIDYTLLIPKHEKGVRSFCLWAIGFAVLTLRKINRHLDFSAGSEVKISRRSVKSTILVTRLTMTHDRLVRSLFQLAKQGLPVAPTGGA